MRTTIYLILIAFSITKVQAQESDAPRQILIKIMNAEIAIKEKRKFNQSELSEIICLTNIGTKKGEGSYIGIISYPDESEIQMWKDWYEKNKTKISYSTTSDIFNKEVYNGKQKVIQVEYEIGKFRNTTCGQDKDLEDWFQKSNVRN